VLPSELPGGIERLQLEAKRPKASDRDLQSRRLRGAAPQQRPGAWRRAGRCGHRPADQAGWPRRSLLEAVTWRPAQPVRSAAVIADAPIDCAALLKKLIERFGGKGGGRPDLAQGGGFQGTPDEIVAFARDLLLRL
jgi:hypothetical protein